MSRTTQHPKETSFNMRLDARLKDAFTKAAEAEDRPAAQLVRTFMRAYVQRSQRRAFETAARRQSLEAAAIARDPRSDEYEVLREIEAELADESFWTDGTE